MNNAQDKFYSSISAYYAEIFPYQPKQLEFILQLTGKISGKTFLDMGCATGELACQLAGQGAMVTGIDLNHDLLDQASKKRNDCLNCSSENPDFRVGNMLELEQDFSPSRFDNVLCFGNTLVHLESADLVATMFNGVRSVLKPGGSFLLQILNYDFILDEQVTQLPLIENDNIRFERKYVIEKNNPLIGFQTALFLKKENIQIENKTFLLALRSHTLSKLLEESGFNGIRLFSGFDARPFGGKHLPLVAACFRRI